MVSLICLQGRTLYKAPPPKRNMVYKARVFWRLRHFRKNSNLVLTCTRVARASLSERKRDFCSENGRGRGRYAATPLSWDPGAFLDVCRPSWSWAPFFEVQCGKLWSPSGPWNKNKNAKCADSWYPLMQTTTGYHCAGHFCDILLVMWNILVLLSCCVFLNIYYKMILYCVGHSDCSDALAVTLGPRFLLWHGRETEIAQELLASYCWHLCETHLETQGDISFSVFDIKIWIYCFLLPWFPACQMSCW